MALVLLQGGDELLHLGEGLLIVDGEKHSGLDEYQLGRHGYKFAGHLQVQLLALVHPVHVLVQNHRNLDVLDLHLVLGQQAEDQVQRAGKVLHVLRLCLDHLFQMKNRRLYVTHPRMSRICEPITSASQGSPVTRHRNCSTPLMQKDSGPSSTLKNTSKMTAIMIYRS